jgi:uncharacterized OB-fold protein
MALLAHQQQMFEQEKLCFQACNNCRHAWQWKEARGVAKLVSFVVYHHAFHESVKPEIPYAVGIVELEEGARMISRIDGARPGVPLDQGFSVGQDLILKWTQRAGATVPLFMSKNFS